MLTGRGGTERGAKMVLLNMTFNYNGLARHGGSQCPLRSPDEIANGSCQALWRRGGDVINRARSSPPPPRKEGAPESPCSDTQSTASTPWPSKASSPASTSDVHEGGLPDAPSWHGIRIPSSAAAVPSDMCEDRSGLSPYPKADKGGGDDDEGDMLLVEEAPNVACVGGPLPTSISEGREQAAGGRGRRTEVMWPSRQPHQGYPDPAQEIKFMQHVDQQFLRYYPCSMSGRGGGRRTENPDGRDCRARSTEYQVTNTDAAAASWGGSPQWEQEDMSMDAFVDGVLEEDGLQGLQGDGEEDFGDLNGSGMWADPDEWDGRGRLRSAILGRIQGRLSGGGEDSSMHF